MPSSLLVVCCVVLLAGCAWAHGPDDLVAVPGRGLVARHCVHPVPDGATITRLADGNYLVHHAEQGLKYVVTAEHEACPGRVEQAAAAAAAAAPFQGWQAYVQDLSRQTYTAFLGNWNVPAAPASPDTSSVIFFFTGLQDSGDGNPTIDIIQPVLQFGDRSAATGSGLFWGIASWYVPSSGRSFVSTLKQVKTGDNIFGNMTITGSDCWYILTAVVGQPVTTTLNICQSPLSDQPAAFVTEEAYASGCNDYPPASSPLTFVDLKLYQGATQVSPSWTIRANQPNCNSVVTPSGSSVKFTYN